MAHGTSTADNVVSFISSKAKNTSQKQKIKQLKRRRPFVKVSYDSGSDADVESDEDHVKENVITATADEPPLRKKAKTPRKKIKPKSSALPEIKAEELSNIDDIDGVDDDDDDLDIDADTGFDIDDDDIEEDEEFKVSDPESDPEEVPRVPGAGWADAMAKILQREIPKESPSTSAILSKSKEYEKAKLQEEEEYAKRNKVKLSRDQWEQLGRARPKVTDKVVERRLQRIATRGVVQLFNAVKKEQKHSGEPQEKTLSISDRRRAEEIRSASGRGNFLDLLRGTPVVQKRSNLQKKVGENPDGGKKPSWSVLQDNFMMGATMKDWDKKSDSGSDVPSEAGSDMNSFSD
ncbi:RRP15-like protein [Asterias rubens]|uniref:RRP15-like protein n=1 Tax=Asterias rubens TaxID=7604 RepID=UPI0014558A36|nr:RRP15-like protein [Asterias rubens]